VPFLRLTRDRRGFENTYLMHADRPGDRPRILYWYRTAPGVMLGRAALDEDAIRTIEDQHPDIEFDWPAILALSEVMTPEDEAPAPQPQRKEKKRSALARENKRELRRDDRAEESPVAVDATESVERPEFERVESADAREESVELRRDYAGAAVGRVGEPVEPRNRLLEELAGREIGSRLRGRHAEIIARIEALDADGAEKDALFKRAEALDPELWMTPEAVLEGVRNADLLFEKLKADLAHSSRE
jgi:hypothetical protein